MQCPGEGGTAAASNGGGGDGTQAFAFQAAGRQPSWSELSAASSPCAAGATAGGGAFGATAAAAPVAGELPRLLEGVVFKSTRVAGVVAHVAPWPPPAWQSRIAPAAAARAQAGSQGAGAARGRGSQAAAAAAPEPAPEPAAAAAAAAPAAGEQDTTPVILGKALKVSYHCTPTYIEVDIDISANSVANYVTGMVRGATSSLVVDLGIVLEGTAPWELLECLLGAFRVHRLNTASGASRLDYGRELPLLLPAAAAPFATAAVASD
ncbi:hypothetical protein HXX76_013849 [Chlamydomonas incerta]|uniref:Protein ENHANCED DISEASE RESISTANCE 2 C-terminal domain-containing protein n=1 Tax=Chlamydomonas incerta TaxID=51695 RepID=A0A835SI07_CHLIN|nr:hypothetical protein HXX76_013849 [Chlamydomonas incerta]|eukprot:KAG2425267.1 hypothetical protein HXX76_013849 [Chlamydomonas incerta]